MNIHPQIIKQDGKAAFVVLPIKDYAKMLQALEEQEDIQAVEEFFENSEETFPIEVAEQIADGVSPIKVFRQYRKLSQVKLADQVNVSKQYISQLESKDRDGSTRVLKKIAKILNVSLDDL
ncbi:MAG: helix-turn-helix domain-containing protein [Francisellaceae bacterium]|jgi:DNA-binding XRE family transcriptional regulator|nr:helix-turn-helix domain-containing protein [Francisellaceae bacterium]MBT6207890.1 helix-turn-helix domain-containing protein [Francisellaceae bacterium]MBT6538041.1 helix-turn-helix domain-containing protein [Francisellaceae bacterium]